MSESPKRRWLRFSLRTLFVAVTALGCWLGWELNWIRQRQAFLDAQLNSYRPLNEDYIRLARTSGWLSDQAAVRAPGMLWMFGERGFMVVALPPRATIDDFETARRLFPEAQIDVTNEDEMR